MAGTFDESSGEMAVYLDGVQLNTKSVNRSIEHRYGNGFSLGSMKGSRNFTGCLDEIQVYGRALTETEVQQWFQP